MSKSAVIGSSRSLYGRLGNARSQVFSSLIEVVSPMASRFTHWSVGWIVGMGGGRISGSCFFDAFLLRTFELNKQLLIFH